MRYYSSRKRYRRNYCKGLYISCRNKINILDISQTIVSGYFNMMMIVDTGASAKTYDEVITDLDKLGEEIGVAIKCQREEIFDMMHRI